MKLHESIGRDQRPPFLTKPTTPASMRRDWDVEGLTCVADAVRLERRLRRINGVLDAVVNPVTERAYVTFDGQRLSELDLDAVILRFGYSVG